MKGCATFALVVTLYPVLVGFVLLYSVAAAGLLILFGASVAFGIVAASMYSHLRTAKYDETHEVM